MADRRLSVRRRAGVAGAADRLKFRDALIDRRKRRRFGVRLGLVPVGHGIVVVGTMIGVAVLDGGANGFVERNR